VDKRGIGNRKIRQFRELDARECSQLVRACIQLDRDIPPVTLERLLREESPQLMCKRAALFYLVVYELDGTIAGLAGLDMNEVRLLYVDPKHQRRGIGRALLQYLERMVPPAFFCDIFLYSTPSAESFYRERGYQSLGDHVFDLEGHPLPTVFMVKPIQSVSEGHPS
jgi:GNAT superfamily N-acetyltransferase